MYKKINITSSHLRVLALFTRGFDRQLYIREVGRLAQASPRTAQLILDDLERKGALSSTTRGKIRLFAVRQTPEARDYLVLAEHYKRLSFLGSSDLVRGIAEKLLQHTEGIVLLFGSYAKGIQKKVSDMDILVVGTADREAVRKISALYGIPIDIKETSPEIFRKKLRTDVLLQEVLEDHIALRGAEELVFSALPWQTSDGA